MPTETDEFWTRYRAHIARIMPPLKPGDGVPEAEVTAAEHRLGFGLPRLLREYYLLTGERDDINRAFNRLYPLDELSLDGDILIFYTETQGLCEWGVRLGDDGPAVLRRTDGDDEWDPDFDHLSQFLYAMLYLQAVNGGLRYCGVGTANGTALAAELPNWTAYATGGIWKNFVLVRPGQVLYIMDTEPTPSVFGGARTKRLFRELEKTFNVSWDYSDLD